MGEEMLLWEEHRGNAPDQNTEEYTPKPNRSDYIARLPWLICKYKVKPKY